MKLRTIKHTHNWDDYHDKLSYNMMFFDKLKIPYRLKRGFNKLLLFYPLETKKEQVFFKLPNNRKVPFLFNYLIKVSNKNNLNKSSIKRLIDLKKRYDQKKNNTFSKIEYIDRLKINMIEKNYDGILNMYLQESILNRIYMDLIHYMVNIININIDKNILLLKENSRVIHKKRKIRDTVRGLDIRYDIENVEIPRSVPDFKSKGKSIFSLNDDMKSVSVEISEIEKVINKEVEKRLLKFKYELSSKNSKSKMPKYDDYYNPTNIPAFSETTEGNGVGVADINRGALNNDMSPDDDEDDPTPQQNNETTTIGGIGDNIPGNIMTGNMEQPGNMEHHDNINIPAGENRSQRVNANENIQW